MNRFRIGIFKTLRLLALMASGLACAGTSKIALGEDASERAAILEVMEKTFTAIAAEDPEKWRAVLTEEARSLSFGVDENGRAVPRERSYKEDLKTLKPSGRTFFERWLGEPTVMVSDNIAVVWGRYDFWIDGAFSHCGVDTANLGKIDGEWRIAHFMWTIEDEGCESEKDSYPGGTSE